jgi:hypothetical protein
VRLVLGPSGILGTPHERREGDEGCSFFLTAGGFVFVSACLSREDAKTAAEVLTHFAETGELRVPPSLEGT